MTPSSDKPTPKVQLKQQVLQGYPALNLHERDLQITPPYVFISLVYQKPIGASKVGSAEVELFDPHGQFFAEKIYFEFAFSEQERMLDAQQPAAFSLKPGVGAKEAHEYTAQDFKNKYRDVAIEGMTVIETKGNLATFEITYFFTDLLPKVANPTRYKVQVTIDTAQINKIETFALTETIPVKVRELLRDSATATITKNIGDLEHFQINPDFYKAGPPLTISSRVIIPQPYIELVTIDYFPPKDVDSREAQILVEYRLNGRLNSERVTVYFAQTIREEAERLVQAEPESIYRYVPTIRRVPPAYMEAKDFAYNGRLPLRVVGVEYDSAKLDPDNRVVPITLLIDYRTAVVKLTKHIEFQYSLNEYINEGETKARVENKSIAFENNVLTPDVFYSNIDSQTLVFRKPKILLSNAKVSKNYPYKAIKEIKHINFDPNSRLQMFKVTVEEYFGERTFLRAFEKQVTLDWSYREWKLSRLVANDIKVDENQLPEYPKRDLSEHIFQSTPEYSVVGMEYHYPSDDAKVIDFNIEVEVGERTVSLTRRVTFKHSYNEYKQKLRNLEGVNTLRALKPSDFTLLVDTREKAPSKILPEQIIGAPHDVKVNVIYQPPKPGERVTRVIVELSKNNFTTGFEQTLIFDKAS